MIEFIHIKQVKRWEELLSEFPNGDVYYKVEYISAYANQGDQNIVLLYAIEGNVKFCFPIVVSDIGKDEKFKEVLPLEEYYDAETPYGYGGPLFIGDDRKCIARLFAELRVELKKRGIVSLFIRFHPLLKNYEQYPEVYDAIRYLHHTIYMDTSSEDKVFNNLDSKNRNMIRKAQKNGIHVEIDMDFSTLPVFKKIYNATMAMHNATDYYYFSDEFYHMLKGNLGDDIFIMNAVNHDEIVASSIFIRYNDWLHYFLSGSKQDYRKMAPSNLLLYRAALWAVEHGLTRLHLGGGISEDDSLFGFKKQFNKRGYAEFWIGKIIADKEKYRKLMKLRKRYDDKFDIDNDFMIQYRR